MGPKVKQEPPSASEVRNDREDSGKRQERPKAFTIKYKRPRGSRACSVCRSRKVRCDAEIHIPCTNCITFGCECVLPEVKKRGNSSGDSKAKRRQQDVPLSKDRVASIKSDPSTWEDDNIDELKSSGGNEPILNISQVSVPPSLTSNYKVRPSLHKKESLSNKNRAPLTFLGSSSIGGVASKVGENHIHLTDDVFGQSENSLDSVELEILKLRGAFLLPSKELSLDLVNSYFKHVHPLMPVINRTEFMIKFEDPNDSPSLMLLQAVLLCGCRVSDNPQLLDTNGSNNLASLTFFRRAKALYESSYESDSVSIIQTLILIGSYWEGPEDVTKNSFYWTKVAIALSQGFGLHRDASNSKSLSEVEKKIWRRIWWCLFEKDRNVAIAFGRPLSIDLADCDVPMLTLEDFDENDPENGILSPYPVNETEALYFIHLVKLAEVTGIIIKHQYTVKSETVTSSRISIIKHCDMLMGIWFTNLPPQLVFSLSNASTQNFYTCLLNAQYYNRLYLIHRSNLLKMARSNSTNPNNYKYPSWGISFQAARMISIVSKILLEGNQIRYCPAMFVYILFSALMMLIYHVDSPNNVIASTASDSLFVSRAVLKDLGKYWPIAGVLLRLFDKYADDKIKRAQVIENNSKVVEYHEREAASKMRRSTDATGIYSNTRSEKNSSLDSGVSPVNSHASGISPKGELYEKPNTLGMSNEVNISENSKNAPEQPKIEDLVQQLKRPLSREPLNEDTSPTTSSNSFPDVSLVTESMPAQNFFENFQPTQLFPQSNYSMPSTRAQSPSTIDTGAFYNGDNTDVTSARNQEENTNFVDNTYLGMNLQSGMENNLFNDDVSSFFN